MEAHLSRVNIGIALLPTIWVYFSSDIEK